MGWANYEPEESTAGTLGESDDFVANLASLKAGMKRINTSVFKEECCLLNWRVVQTWGTSCSESWARKMWDGMGYTIGIKCFKEVNCLNLKVIQIGGTCFSESQARKL